jgi:hypothetical protein
MCLYVYLVTDSNLPELPWDKKQPAFNVHHLKRKEKFLRDLSGANAYILGSHEGCGCGFILDELSDPQDRAASEDSRRKLCEYVEGVVRSEAGVVLLAAWQGDERKPPVRARVTAQDLFAYPWDRTWDAPHLIEVRPTLGLASSSL